jgi:AraC family transcriptional activator FtrA
VRQWTINRRFKAAKGASAGEWQLSERLARARDMLETTDLTIDNIASAYGLGSGPNLRHQFRTRL